MSEFTHSSGKTGRVSTYLGVSPTSGCRLQEDLTVPVSYRKDTGLSNVVLGVTGYDECFWKSLEWR